MTTLLYLLFVDIFFDYACVFLFLSIHLEVALPTQEEIPTECKMTTQERMTTQYETDVWRLTSKRPSQLRPQNPLASVTIFMMFPEPSTDPRSLDSFTLVLFKDLPISASLPPYSSPLLRPPNLLNLTLPPCAWRWTVGAKACVDPLRLRLRRAAPSSQVLPDFEVISCTWRSASADQAHGFFCSNLDTAKSLGNSKISPNSKISVRTRFEQENLFPKRGPTKLPWSGFCFLVCNADTQLALQYSRNAYKWCAVIRWSADSRPNRTSLSQWTLDTWMLFWSDEFVCWLWI